MIYRSVRSEENKNSFGELEMDSKGKIIVTLFFIYLFHALLCGMIYRLAEGLSMDIITYAYAFIT